MYFFDSLIVVQRPKRLVARSASRHKACKFVFVPPVVLRNVSCVKFKVTPILPSRSIRTWSRNHGVPSLDSILWEGSVFDLVFPFKEQLLTTQRRNTNLVSLIFLKHVVHTGHVLSAPHCALISSGARYALCPALRVFDPRLTRDDNTTNPLVSRPRELFPTAFNSYQGSERIES